MKELLEKLNKINEEGVRAQHDTTDAIIHQSSHLESLDKTAKESGKFTRINSILASEQVNKINQLNNIALAGLTSEQRNILDQQRRKKANDQLRYQQGLSERSKINEDRRLQSALAKDAERLNKKSIALLKTSVGIAANQFNIRKLEILANLARFNSRTRMMQLQATKEKLLLSNVIAIREHIVGAVTPEMAKAELNALDNLVTTVTIMDSGFTDRFLWRKELAKKERKDLLDRESRDRQVNKTRDQRKESIDNKNRRAAKIDAEEAAQEQKNQNGKLLNALDQSKGKGFANSVLGDSSGGKGFLKTAGEKFIDVAELLTGAGAGAIVARLGLGPALIDDAKQTGNKRTKISTTAKSTRLSRVLGRFGFGVLGGFAAFDGAKAAREEEERLLEENARLSEQSGFPITLDPAFKRQRMKSAFNKEFGISLIGGQADFIKEVAVMQNVMPIPGIETEEDRQKVLDFSVKNFLREKSEPGTPLGLATEEGGIPLLLMVTTKAAVDKTVKGIKDFLTPPSNSSGVGLSRTLTGDRNLVGTQAAQFGPPKDPIPVSVKELTEGAELMKLVSDSTGNVNNYITNNVDNSQRSNTVSQINNRPGPRTPIQTGSVMNK